MIHPTFTKTELLQIRHFLAEPEAFALTELEQRACRHVLEQTMRGEAVSEDFAALVRHVLDAAKAEEEEQEPSHPPRVAGT